MAKIIDNYILLEGIGQGSFGEVHKGRNLISKEAVAVKTIKLERFLKDTQLRDMIINEIQALKKLEDQYIVRMIKMLKSANNIYLVYEFLNGGSLSKMLEERGRIPEKEALTILFGVFKGFKTLHSEKIIHRNMNPNNLFFNEGLIKVKNFFCCKSPISQKNFDPENPPYAAPEIILKSNNEDKSDIFSLGLILYKMLFGCLPQPLDENTTMGELNDIYKFSGQESFKVEGVSDYSINLLESMLAFDPQKRVDWEILFLQSEESSKTDFGTISSHNQSSNFETLGQNFYISQQSHNFSTQVQSVQQELQKRRTTNTSQLNEFSNKVTNSTQNLHISGKENIDVDEPQSSIYSQDKVFAKTMDKESLPPLQIQNGFYNIVNQILEFRNNFQLILSGISKIYELDSWGAKIKPEICVMFLLKKAVKKCQDCIEFTESPDNDYDKRWNTCKQKKEILVILRKDLDDLVKQFWRFQQSTENQHEELQSIEIQDLPYIHNILMSTSKQIQLELNQTRSSFKNSSQLKEQQRLLQVTDITKQASLAIFLVDQVRQESTKSNSNNEDLISNLQRQPYFKKLEDFSRERILEVLDQKLRE